MISHPNFSGTTTGTEVASAFADQIRGKTVIITGCSPNNIGKALLKPSPEPMWALSSSVVDQLRSWIL